MNKYALGWRELHMDPARRRFDWKDKAAFAALGISLLITIAYGIYH